MPSQPTQPGQATSIFSQELGSCSIPVKLVRGAGRVSGAFPDSPAETSAPSAWAAPRALVGLRHGSDAGPDHHSPYGAVPALLAPVTPCPQPLSAHAR